MIPVFSTLDPEMLLTTDQLSQYLQISVSSLNKARMEPGKGPRFIKVGASVRYRVGDVRTYLDEMSRRSVRVAMVTALSDDDLPDPEQIEAWLRGEE